MTRACHAAVRMATGQVLSDAEIDQMLYRMADRAERLRAKTADLSRQEAYSQAARQLTREELREALFEKRRQVASDIAKKGLQRDSDAMDAAGFSPGQRLEALTVGISARGPGVAASTDAEGRAREADLYGMVQVGLSKMPGLNERVTNALGFGESGFARKVAAEMARLNGAGAVEPTGDEGALHAARVFVQALRKGREMQNAVGAWIDELPGYIARQSHDAEKIAGGYWRELAEVARSAKETGKPLDLKSATVAAETRAFGAWRDFILPKLDPKTFDALSPDMFDTDAARSLQGHGVLRDAGDLRELMLHRIFLDILTGRHEEMTGADDSHDFRAPPSRARQVSEGRSLHFKSPDDWMSYNDRYGRGSLYAGIINQLGRAGRNTALMRRWGPNPELGWQAEKDRLGVEARGRPGGAGLMKQLQERLRQAQFDQINGTAERPTNMRLATTMRTIRQWEAATKLGGIILSKATDMVLSGSTMARAGAGFLGGYAGFAKGIARLGSADEKAAAELMHVGARAYANHLTSAFRTNDGPLGWSAWATQMVYKAGLFTFANEGVHKGIAQVLAAHLGGQATRAFDALEAGTRETFERFGITPADWDHARRSQARASDGATYWGMDKVTDETVRLKFSMMIHDLVENSTGEARARERALTTFGTSSGTAIGEAVRMLTQLKGFTTSVVLRHLVPAASGFAGKTPAACLAQLILGGTLAGFFSMNAKMISAGQVPRGPLGQSADETRKIWTASLVQGGGLGMWGDFLFGDQNRNGADFSFSQLGGPAVSDAEQLVKVVQQAVAGGEVSETTGRSPIPGELTRLAGRNIPIVNTWYTRLALDYLILWRLQEAVSPGYLQRYQSRVETQEGRQFFLAPTSAR